MPYTRERIQLHFMFDADSEAAARPLAEALPQRLPEFELVSQRVEPYWKIESVFETIAVLHREYADPMISPEQFGQLLLRFATDWERGAADDPPNAEFMWNPGEYALRFTPALRFANAHLWIRTARPQWRVNELMQVDAADQPKLAEHHGKRGQITYIAESNLPVQMYTLRLLDDGGDLWIAEYNLKYTGEMIAGDDVIAEDEPDA